MKMVQPRNLLVPNYWLLAGLYTIFGLCFTPMARGETNVLEKTKDFATSSVQVVEDLVMSQVVIESVEVRGRTSMTSSGLISALDIPIGVPLTTLSSADLISELESKLNASRRFAAGSKLKLIKGTRFPNQILVAELTDVSSGYWGVSVSHQNVPKREQYGSQRSTMKLSELHGYFGDRNYQESGVALDISAITAQGIYEYEGDYSTGSYRGKFNLLMQGLNVAMVKTDLLAGRVYIGGGILISGGSIFSNSQSIFSDNFLGDSYYSEYTRSSRTDNWSGNVSSVTGIRFGRFNFEIDGTRTASRTFRFRENDDLKYFKNGKPSDSSKSYMSSSDSIDDGVVTFNNRVTLNARWTQKSLLSLAEPGIDARAAWTRAYDNEGTEEPVRYYNLSYTLAPAEWLYLTPTMGQKLEIQHRGDQRNKIKKSLQLGLLVDGALSQESLVSFEFYRIGGKRSDFDDDEETSSSAYNLENRLALSWKYASQDLIMSFSLIYGVNRLQDDGWFNGFDQVSQRLGLQ